MMHSRHPDRRVSIAKLQGATQKANKLTPSLHCSGRTNKNANLKNPSAFLFVCLFVLVLFSLAREQISVKKHTIESRFVTRTEKVLFAGMGAHFSTTKLDRLGLRRG